METKTEIIEMWKPVRGFESYEVSQFGNCREVETKKPAGLYRYCSNGLHVCVALREVFSLSHAVAENFVPGKSKERCCVIHIDGNKANARADNLIWATHGDAATASKYYNKRQRIIDKYEVLND